MAGPILYLSKPEKDLGIKDSRYNQTFIRMNYVLIFPFVSNKKVKVYQCSRYEKQHEIIIKKYLSHC